MNRYYVNKLAQSNGDHEVHKQGCHRLPDSWNRIDLGYQRDDAAALRAAQEFFPHSADGCYYCCPAIHRH